MWGSGKKKAKSGNGGKSTFDQASCTNLFNKYTTEDDPFAISMEGIADLCDDLDLDPTVDIRVLVLFFKLGANAKPGEISQAEWNRGCEELGLEKVEDFKKLLPSLDTGFMDHEDFRKFYKFVFQFSREGTNKTIEKDMVVALLQMVLCDRSNPHLNPFCEFLNRSGEENERISLDAWQSFLAFSMETDVGCEEYDMDGGAWPVLIDEYVTWKRGPGEKNK
ncbi:hypothetical protein TrRE_jg2709 [Triparma retinervis]|uniref:Defective in cullin neddylation protein n=1 Tax=Triparma retinervis TaxID=2557542 RepID=A0A9W6ZYK7_9STRA|nr:hypothetical protein TrRE_jg2709 [Triparma retinervis]